MPITIDCHGDFVDLNDYPWERTVPSNRELGRAKRVESARKAGLASALSDRNRARTKPMRCVETGQVFESSAAAMSWLKGEPVPSCEAGGIRTAALKGHRYGGYHWEHAGKEES